jgi:Tfp pilus assembly protein PilN
MKIHHLDFAPPSFARTVYLTKFRTWLFGCLGIALCISAIFFGLQQLTTIDENENLLQQLTLQLNKRNNKNSTNRITKTNITEEQASAVNKAIAQLNFPWRDVLNAMESATPATIALLSLEPDASRNLVKGVAEAKDHEVMVRYIELLKREDFFDGVFLRTHEINQLDSNKPVRFQFEAHWIPS